MRPAFLLSELGALCVRLGLLINFNVLLIKNGNCGIANGLEE